MEWNAVMSCPIPPDFWQPFFLNEAPFSQKTAENGKKGLDRQERVVQACHNIRILRHSLSQPVFSMFSHRFSSVFGLFTIVQGSFETRSKVCRPSFKGLSKPFKAVFVLFPSKFVYRWPV